MCKTDPDSGLEVQYLALEIQAQTLGEDVNSPHSLHKNLSMGAYPIQQLFTINSTFSLMIFLCSGFAWQSLRTDKSLTLNPVTRIKL